MSILSINAPTSERIKYDFTTLTPEQIYDHVKALEDLLDAVNGSDLDLDIEVGDDPAKVRAEINARLERDAVNHIENAGANPYKEFFDDCVGALNGHWPCADVTDDDLKGVILAAITKGDAE
jgi:hypothetical protein